MLGLTFKPATDDLREAPSIPVVQELLALGAQVWVHDPVAMEKARELLPETVRFARDCEECLQDAEAALLVTEWPEYLRSVPATAPRLMKRPLIIDGRNAIPGNARAGLDYHGIGIPGTSRKEEDPVLLKF
ncbi:UDP-glucose 6-dehydrogenase YwqF [compost metagenome]